MSRRRFYVQKKRWDWADFTIVTVLVVTTLYLYGSVLRAVAGW